MKLFITSLFLVSSLSAFAESLPLNLRGIEKPGNSVTISVETAEKFSSMCALHASSLKIVNPQVSGARDEFLVSSGEIELVFEIKAPNFDMCLTAFGPHRGSVTLEIGETLPSLIPGTHYILTINGKRLKDRLYID